MYQNHILNNNKFWLKNIELRRLNSYAFNLNKSNTSGDKSIYVDELIKPIPKKSKLKWIIELYAKVNLSKDMLIIL